MFFDMNQQSREKQLAAAITNFTTAHPDLQFEHVGVEQCLPDLCVRLRTQGKNVVFGMLDDGNGNYKQIRFRVGNLNFKSEEYNNEHALDFNTCKDALFAAINKAASINNNNEISLDTPTRNIRLYPGFVAP